MNMTFIDIDIFKIISIALKAGSEILKFYKSEFSVTYKDDNSPLTSADTAANNIITEGLTHLYPDIPVLSEEGKHTSYEIRKHWPLFWLVDPLDGTKEFLEKRGDFTVNIALIENQKPVLGVVYAPDKSILYYAKKGEGAWKVANDQVSDYHDNQIIAAKSVRIPLDNIRDNSDRKIIVASRSHMSPETHDFINAHFHDKKSFDVVSVGSSLKICLVADGSADMYPRLGPTMEWDTAAAHAIVLESGKKVHIMEGTEIAADEVVYNKSTLLNPWFIVH